MSLTIGQCWKKVGEDLGLRVEAPFNLILEGGIELDFEALIVDFGAPKGMLITTDFSKVEKIDDQLREMGYGFSIMSHPSQDRLHDSEGFKYVLLDWGWSGDPNREPQWLSCLSAQYAEYDYSDED